MDDIGSPNDHLSLIRLFLCRQASSLTTDKELYQCGNEVQKSQAWRSYSSPYSHIHATNAYKPCRPRTDPSLPLDLTFGLYLVNVALW